MFVRIETKALARLITPYIIEYALLTFLISSMIFISFQVFPKLQEANGVHISVCNWQRSNGKEDQNQKHRDRVELAVTISLTEDGNDVLCVYGNRNESCGNQKNKRQILIENIDGHYLQADHLTHIQMTKTAVNNPDNFGKETMPLKGSGHLWSHTLIDRRMMKHSNSQSEAVMTVEDSFWMSRRLLSSDVDVDETSSLSNSSQNTPNGQSFHDVAVCETKECQDFISSWSCFGSCGNDYNNKFAPCSCHHTCLLFNQCCFDYPSVCPLEHAKSLTYLSLQPGIHVRCDPFLDFLVVSECPANASEAKKELCGQEKDVNDINSILPVTDTNTSWHFKNKYCLKCWNEDADFEPWLLGIDFSSLEGADKSPLPRLLKFAIKNSETIEWKSKSGFSIYTCSNGSENREVSNTMTGDICYDHPDLSAMCENKRRNLSIGNSSCHDRCNSTRTFPCSCEPQCILHETCCNDIVHFCRDNFVKALNLSVQYPHLTTRCDDVLSVPVISHCPPTASNHSKSRCMARDPFSPKTLLPVTDSITHWQFKNFYCWDCWHQRGKAKQWSARALESAIGYSSMMDGAKHILAYMLDNHLYTYWFPKSQFPRHPCISSNITCMMRIFYKIFPIPEHCYAINNYLSSQGIIYDFPKLNTSEDFKCSNCSSSSNDANCSQCEVAGKEEGLRSIIPDGKKCTHISNDAINSKGSDSDIQNYGFNLYLSGVRHICPNDIRRKTVHLCPTGTSDGREKCENLDAQLADSLVPVIDSLSGVIFQNYYCWLCWNRSGLPVSLSAMIHVDESLIPKQKSMQSLMQYMVDNPDAVVWETPESISYRQCNSQFDPLNARDCENCSNCFSVKLDEFTPHPNQMTENENCIKCIPESKCKQFDQDKKHLKPVVPNNMLAVHISLIIEGSKRSTLFTISRRLDDNDDDTIQSVRQCNELGTNCQSLHCNAVGYESKGRCVPVQRYSMLLKVCVSNTKNVDKCKPGLSDNFLNILMENEWFKYTFEDNQTSSNNSVLFYLEDHYIREQIEKYPNIKMIQFPTNLRDWLAARLDSNNSFLTAMKVYEHKETKEISILIYLVAAFYSSIKIPYYIVESLLSPILPNENITCGTLRFVHVASRFEERPLPGNSKSFLTLDAKNFVIPFCGIGDATENWHDSDKDDKILLVEDTRNSSSSQMDFLNIMIILLNVFIIIVLIYSRFRHC